MEKEYLLENSSRKKKFKWKRNNVVIRGGGRGTINESSTISYFSKLSHNKTTLKTRRRKNGDKQIGGLNPRPYILEFRATSPITPPSPGIHLYLANATQKQKPNSNLFGSFFSFLRGGEGLLAGKIKKTKVRFFWIWKMPQLIHTPIPITWESKRYLCGAKESPSHLWKYGKDAISQEHENTPSNTPNLAFWKNKSYKI